MMALMRGGVGISIAELAVGLGADVMTIEKPGELLEQGAATVFRGQRPLIIDVHIAAGERMPVCPRFDASSEAMRKHA